MSQARSVDPAKDERPVEISRSDLLAAWKVLENLAVSIDQIGGFYGDPTEPDGEGRRHALLDALAAYMSKDLVESIGDARSRLGRYLPDDEAEALLDSIPYWDYAGTKP